MDFFKEADAWFMQLAIVVLAGYFLWSIKNILDDFKQEVAGLKDLIGKLFAADSKFEKRLSNLEGRCFTMHGSGSGIENTGGRRFYDPEERLDKD